MKTGSSPFLLIKARLSTPLNSIELSNLHLLFGQGREDKYQR
jgi:hypothetical protein